MIPKVAQEHLSAGSAFLLNEVSTLPASAWDHIAAVLFRAEGAADQPMLLAVPGQYRLFQAEDLYHWLVFLVVVASLVIFDNAVLYGKGQRPTFHRSLCIALFWVLCGMGFCCYVYFMKGANAAFDWSTGYMLEWMLSVDNLFVYRSIFALFKTPEGQKHKPLFYGIAGAVVFRLGFFVVEQMVVRTFGWVQMLLGCFLIYTGIKVVAVEQEQEEDAPVTESSFFSKIARHLNFVDSYAPEPKFLSKVPVDSRTGELVLADWQPPRLPQDYDAAVCGGDVTRGRDLNFEYRFTRLFLVVLCLEAADVVFAVDSVSAIVGQIPDLFLAYSSSVFAMLGLRATFFVVDELVKLFTLLPYGAAFILVFIGGKLMMHDFVTVSAKMMWLILLCTLIVSIVASFAYDHFKSKSKENIDPFLVDDAAPIDDAPVKDV